MLIDSGAIPSGTAIRVTLEEADDIVTGDDLPRGPAMRILPEDFVPQGTITVDVNLQLQPEDDASRLALFVQRGSTITTNLDLEFLSGGGQVRATVPGFGVVQVGLLAPVPGTPDGAYRSKTLQVITLDGTPGSDQGGTIARVVDESFTFRADGSGTRSVGSFTLLSRRFLTATPHHEDLVSSFFTGSLDFTWTSEEPGRFSLSYVEDGATVTVDGVTTTNADVISLVGQSDLTEFMTVGVRAAATTPVTNADLTGRWATASMGVEFVGTGTTPFSNRFTNSFRDFIADGDGMLTYGNDDVFATDQVFGTNLPAALHTRNEFADTSGGTEDYTVQFDGRFVGAGNQRSGYLNPESGFMVSTLVNTETLSVALEIAVQQPADGMPDTTGSYHFTQLDADVVVEAPAEDMSAFTLLPRVGLFTPGATTAVRDYLSSMRSTNSAVGTRGTGTNINWTNARSLEALDASTGAVPFAPDATGTHAPESGLRWYAVSGDGNLIIGIAPNASPEADRGLFIGLR